MITLYTRVLCPFCRMAQLLLTEAGLNFSPSRQKPWELDGRLLPLNPDMSLPVLKLDASGDYLVGIYPLFEALGQSFLGSTQPEKAEVRRLVAWFNGPMWNEVTRPILFEKKEKMFLGQDQGGGPPNLGVLRAGAACLENHLDYLSYLVDQRDWLAGPSLTLADIAAAGQISCTDYLTAVPWDLYPLAKSWYARIKSRPSFRFILQERFAQIPPSRIYADLDF